MVERNCSLMAPQYVIKTVLFTVGAITLQAETYLSDRLVLLLYGRERCLWGGSTGRFHTQYGVGLKIMLD